jgi:glutamate synthase (ferredoxin)
MSLFVIYLIIGLLVVVFIYDITQREHAIIRNFPILGHFRYFLESIGPEIRQYWLSNDKEEMPFNRSERSWIYAKAKKQNSTFGFGTTEQLYETGYPIIKHATFPFKEGSNKNNEICTIPSGKVIGLSSKRKFPYHPQSIINISAMSFGSLGQSAITALNKGAKKAKAFHNTGEGGVSPYHCNGADIVWQIGTGYFGARGEDGKFSLEKLMETIDSNPQIKMIEVKLSQGAKPGKGGILPADKVTPEIASIRGVPAFESCISPNSHSAFSTVDEMIDFIEKIADESGLPVGIKSAIGKIDFWEELAKINFSYCTLYPDRKPRFICNFFNKINHFINR